MSAFSKLVKVHMKSECFCVHVLNIPLSRELVIKYFIKSTTRLQSVKYAGADADVMVCVLISMFAG
jgi:hypothetical protein